MADLSKITLPSGTTYNLKDAQAREDIEAIKGAIAGGVSFLGITTTELTDGATTNPIIIDGTSTSAINGAVVVYGSKEFIWVESDTSWHLLGAVDENLGDLAYKDSASGSFTPHGTVSQPTFTGSESAVTITATASNSGNYQPAGTVSQPTFTGASMTSTGKFTPDGTISKPTFTGASMTSTGKFTPDGSVALTTTGVTTTVSKAATGTATYTPEGTVAAPTITVATAGSTTTIKNPTAETVAKTVVAAAPGTTAPANNLTYYNVSGETLSLYQLGYTTGDSITTANVTVKDGDASYTASAPEFSGTGARLVTASINIPSSATFTGTEGNLSVSGTTTGSVSQPTFTGTEGDVSVSGTTTGSVSQPTFTGTKVQLAGTTTADGTVSQPTFTGTTETVTVS